MWTRDYAWRQRLAEKRRRQRDAGERADAMLCYEGVAVVKDVMPERIETREYEIV
ncbi:MAG: hypothetical protein HYS81_02140 [Candidatus Aenigmatarchaeota archaeon]|nr:MAG: hypothetical protein HYS81_02140 [Candidatus Aenigmarchaeota archaeon]